MAFGVQVELDDSRGLDPASGSSCCKLSRLRGASCLSSSLQGSTAKAVSSLVVEQLDGFQVFLDHLGEKASRVGSLPEPLLGVGRGTEDVVPNGKARQIAQLLEGPQVAQ